MLSEKDIWVRREHCKDLIRAAQRERFARAVMRGDASAETPADPVPRRAFILRNVLRDVMREPIVAR